MWAKCGIQEDANMGHMADVRFFGETGGLSANTHDRALLSIHPANRGDAKIIVKYLM